MFKSATIACIAAVAAATQVEIDTQIDAEGHKKHHGGHHVQDTIVVVRRPPPPPRRRPPPPPRRRIPPPPPRTVHVHHRPVVYQAAPIHQHAAP